jgi:ribonuclease HI
MDCSALRDDLLDVLYGEASPETQRRVDAHAVGCPACRDELLSFREVRNDLQSWKLPEMRPFLPRRPLLARHSLLAAAAALLLATGLAFALRGSELRYEEGRLSFRLGNPAGGAAFETALAEQEARHQQEIAALKTAWATEAHPVALSGDNEVLLRRVAEMIKDSEDRQSRRAEAKLASLADRAETRRRYDLARISAGLAYLDGKNGQHLSRTAELMGYVLEASQKKAEK